jgi:hypothetical protein
MIKRCKYLEDGKNQMIGDIYASYFSVLTEES